MTCFVTIGLCSCQPALINLPKQDCQCKKLEVPPRIPDDLELKIKDGMIEKADDGGSELLRNYHAIRQEIKNY